MKKERIIAFLVLFFAFSRLSAQLAMEHWKTHFSYGKVDCIVSSAENVYALSKGVLFSVNKEYQSLEFYSKISGLSDVKISYIAYSERIKALIILYENANIDLLYDNGEIENIPDISRKNLAYSKNVNYIYFKDNDAFLCTICLL